MIAKLSAETGESVEAIKAKLEAHTGVTGDRLEALLAEAEARAKDGVTDVRTLFAELSQKAGLETAKVSALFEDLKAQYEAKGLAGTWRDTLARFDKDGDGRVLDDLLGMAKGLFGKSDSSDNPDRTDG
ncbi:MAG: hypothetical protein SNJ63_05690 [Sphingomonadaceae bacterium]